MKLRTQTLLACTLLIAFSAASQAAFVKLEFGGDVSPQDPNNYWTGSDPMPSTVNASGIFSTRSHDSLDVTNGGEVNGDGEEIVSSYDIAGLNLRSFTVTADGETLLSREDMTLDFSGGSLFGTTYEASASASNSTGDYSAYLDLLFSPSVTAAEYENSWDPVATLLLRDSVESDGLITVSGDWGTLSTNSYVKTTEVPEPVAGGLLVLGLSMLGLYRRKS